MRYLISYILYQFSGQPIQDLVNEDINRNLKWNSSMNDKSQVRRLHYLLKKSKEFRSIFYFRMKHHKFLCALSRIFLPDIVTIEFGNGGIGGGLMISHYHAVVYPKKAGKNLRVGPGCVIGRNRGGFPTIGDNVYIAANATVIGDIQIGDNVIIGAGSVVTKDIPSNGVYVGNPAHFVKKIENDNNLLNEII